MHSFRLRYIVLGLLIYIQNAFCRTCGSKFEDVASKAILADIVFEGKVIEGKPKHGNNDRYNATFSVKKVLKGSLPRSKSVIIGKFGPEDVDRCITEVVKDSHYLVFIKDKQKDSTEPYYRTAGLPEPSTKQSLRTVRKIVCKKCAKHPKVRMMPTDVSVETGDRIQLRCKVRGAPKPEITWYHNEKPIKHSRNTQIRTGKKSSRLRIRNSHPDHSGVYTCRGTNVLGEHVGNAMVTVTEEKVQEMSPEHAIPCKQQAFCLNGGVCYEIRDLNSQFCRCTPDYVGERCQSKDVFSILKELESREAHDFDRNMTIAGLAVGALVFLAILLVSWCLAKRRREKFEKKKREKLRQAAAMQQPNPMFRPQSAVVAGTNGPVNGGNIQLTQNMASPKQHTDSSTQTEEVSPLAYYDHHNHQHHNHHNSSAQLPRQNTAPLLGFASKDCVAGRAPPATSSTPPPPLPSSLPPSGPIHHTTFALVESDHDNSHRSSPSQTSRTESAHAANEGFPPTSSHEFLPGRGDMLKNNDRDFDQHSDYDNQYFNDSILHKADVECKVNGECAVGSDSGSEVSSLGDEHDLFMNLQLQKKAVHAPQPEDPRISKLTRKQSSEGSRGSSEGNLSWDEFSNPPTYALTEPHAAFNPYAMENESSFSGKLRPSPVTRRVHPPPYSSRRHYAAADVIDGVMYDPDPDATPV